MDISTSPFIGSDNTYSCGCKDIFREEDSLGLNNKEVDQLVEISGERIQGLLAYGIVLLGPELADETTAEQSFSRRLSQYSEQKSNPCKLESITQNIKVSGCEDECYDRSEGNAGGSWVVP